MAKLPICNKCDKTIRKDIVIVSYADRKQTGNAMAIVFHWKANKKEYYHSGCFKIKTLDTSR